jgi:hypothetical protein
LPHRVLLNQLRVLINQLKVAAKGITQSTKGNCHISHMTPVALPQHRAGAGPNLNNPDLEPLHSVKYNRFMYFTFITIRSKQHGASDFLTRLQAFISEVKVRTIFILSQFQELRTERLVRASASSVLREGDWSHMGNMTSPGFRPTPRGLEQFQACQDSFLLSSTTVSMTGVPRTQKD